MSKSVGSVCSGIEAASVAWRGLFEFSWFSEVGDFPSQVLKSKYPSVPNLGNMMGIPNLLKDKNTQSVDIICGGTPCQAFSLAGWKRGLDDERGNLTLAFVDIVDQNDEQRKKHGKEPTVVLWENVEGVLQDKTNAFGCFLSSLGGFDEEIKTKRWPTAGYLHGPKRNIAWRILDAKYFGLPQQRKRIYVLAGGKNYYPENVLFEKSPKPLQLPRTDMPLSFVKHKQHFECFREYTDCLYSAYGTKWNGNAAAYNGSLYVSQNGRLRRFTPLECERLMGFDDNYTDIPKAQPTNRFQALGNSWAVPVVRWIGKRLVAESGKNSIFQETLDSKDSTNLLLKNSFGSLELSEVSTILCQGERMYLNYSTCPIDHKIANLFDVVDVNADERFYITPVGCKGILRRKEERGLSINKKLEAILEKISSEMTDEEIELRSRVQKRGRFSKPGKEQNSDADKNLFLPLFDGED
jgi:DNA (cytosine-5)-methyltransferase 1